MEEHTWSESGAVHHGAMGHAISVVHAAGTSQGGIEVDGTTHDY